METYHIEIFTIRNQPVFSIRSDTLLIPNNPDNSDYQRFQTDWQNGSTVLSSTGSPLSYGSPLS